MVHSFLKDKFGYIVKSAYRHMSQTGCPCKCPHIFLHCGVLKDILIKPHNFSVMCDLMSRTIERTPFMWEKGRGGKCCLGPESCCHVRGQYSGLVSASGI